MTKCERRRREGGRRGSKVVHIVCDLQDGQESGIGRWMLVRHRPVRNECQEEGRREVSV